MQISVTPETTRFCLIVFASLQAGASLHLLPSLLLDVACGRRYLGIDCSVLTGANLSEGIAKDELSEAVIGECPSMTTSCLKVGHAIYVHSAAALNDAVPSLHYPGE